MGGRSKKINPKWVIFANEYLVDGNGLRAAISAGYKETGAKSRVTDLLRRPEIIDLIKKGQEKMEMRLTIQREDVIHELITTMQAAGPKEKFVKLKAIEIINKMMGWDAPQKVEVTGMGAIVVNILKPGEDE